MGTFFTQQKIYNFIKNFTFCLGFFSIGMSIVLWNRETPYVIEHIIYRLDALFVGLWAPTSFIISLLFSNLEKGLKVGK